MGPVMPPSKKPEGTGVSVLSQCCRDGMLSTPPREDDDLLDLSPPPPPPPPGPGKPGKERGGLEDEELTNLNWLHESKNLLKSFGDTVLRSVSPAPEPDDDTPPSPAPADAPYDARHNPNCKPPYSFSCLIFMAIEEAPGKRLPVKDIYNWILEHFPYFSNAPTGWKNSVRHNLSLNKCFKKVDKDRSQSIGKGSLWCIDPEYRQNLIQALKKTPYHPYSHVFSTPPSSPQAYQSTSVSSLWAGSSFFKKNGALLQDPDIAAAAAMMLLTSPPDARAGFPPSVIQNGARVLSRSIFQGVRPLPINPIGSMAAAVRNGISGCRMRGESEAPCVSPLVSSDPKDDHNYSSAKAALKRSSSPDSASSSSSAGERYELAVKTRRDGSDLQDSEPEEEDVAGGNQRHIKREPKDWPSEAAAQRRKPHPPGRARRMPSDALPLKKRRPEKPPESDDEEMKEAAGSLLHLAGIRSCLNNITNRTAKKN